MVAEVWLIDFDSNNHVDLVLVVGFWDESLNWSQCLHVYIGVDTSLYVQNKISK